MLRPTPRNWWWRDPVLFPALDAARRERGVPTHYHVWTHGRTAYIIVDDFFIPEAESMRLAAQYREYVERWISLPAKRWFPRDGFGLANFRGYVPLVVLRDDADEWIAALNQMGQLTFKPDWSFGTRAS